MKNNLLFHSFHKKQSCSVSSFSVDKTHFHSLNVNIPFRTLHNAISVPKRSSQFTKFTSDNWTRICLRGNTFDTKFKSLNATFSTYEEDAVKLATTAGNLFNEGKVDEAIEVMERAISTNPSQVMMRYNLGVYLQNQGRTEEAVDVYKRAVQVEEENKNKTSNGDLALLYANYGLAFMELKKYPAALSLLQKSVQFDPNIAPPYLHMSKIYQDTGKLEEAVKNLEKYQDLHPDFSAKMSLAELYNLQHRYLDAARVTEEIISTLESALSSTSIEEERESVLHILGQQRLQAVKIYVAQSSMQMEGNIPADIDHKINQHTKAMIDIYPQWYVPHRMLGHYYLTQSKLDEALVCFMKAIRQIQTDNLEKSNFEDWKLMIKFIIQQLNAKSKFQECEESVKYALETEPTNSDWRLELAGLYVRMQKPKEAIVEYEAAVEMDPSLQIDAEFLFNVGNAYTLLDKFQEALDYYLKSLAVVSTPETLCNVGYCYKHLGNKESALQYFEQALSKDPRHYMTYLNLADVLFSLNKLREGIEAGEIALEIDPNGHQSDSLRKSLDVMKQKLQDQQQ